MNKPIDPQAVTLSGLIYYPVKGCQGVAVEGSFVERMGLQDDRRMMVVSAQGKFLTQREQPRLALIAPMLRESLLELSAPGFDSIQVELHRTGSTWPVNLWKSKGIPSIDQGEQAARWLSDWLGSSVRLVLFQEGYRRRLNPEFAVDPEDHTGFADGYPILLLSEESLADLNSRLESAVPMNRFRPNMVLRGCKPYSEDHWKRVRIGEVELAIVKPCARCVVTTIDKQTLEQGKEPLKTLASYRRHPLGAIFGQNVIPIKEGYVTTGMPLEVLA